MTAEQLFGLVGGVLVIVFIVFAFRQGFKVKPDDQQDRSSIDSL